MDNNSEYGNSVFSINPDFVHIVAFKIFTG